MNRRNNLKTIAAALASTPAGAAPASQSIQLHVDLNVDPSKEIDLLTHFAKEFKPAMAKQKGYTNVTLLKLKAVKKEPGPVNSNYRLVIGFQTEQQRQDWVASAEHQKVWPLIDACLRENKLASTLYDVAL